ncbi:LytR/AlgR family response regulator transcription factor [Runella slithyformis]|uniref:Two component transcriptional regulator, LytTR family n=1 Tax=Runella slithyformis (strain ATCC 29530 / DSM 19594 / LMG 11500 / NCIMB 11436 / LSU 4) TaxID=761193 RepID=A0A7U3ZM82_RUNSL|nr:LytTR family DNA-binding domain-containing protein [Runella slithyformis]AEI49658.1 two component transcriptional regulator, LytTR family [Runella slithyformis DSM 19594]
MKINTLVVDDNPNWRNTLSKLVALNPVLHLVAACESALEAYGNMAEEDIDLIICDIEMPELSGLGLARSLKNGPLFVFVTSHRHYALDCYEVSPVDFLLKPIEVERFMKSIEKVRVRLSNAPEVLQIPPYFFVREGHSYVQIAYHDVLYMKAQEHYLQIVTKEATYTSLLSLAKIEEQLKGEVFLRVHRSFLVHRSAIAVIHKNDLVLVNGESIPLGDQYRSKISRVHLNPHLLSRN